MNDWTDVDLGLVRRKRRALGMLPVLTDILAVWDYTACATSAEVARLVLGYAIPAPQLDLSLRALTSHDVLWGSLALALALRDASVANSRKGVVVAQLIWCAEKRCLAGCSALICVLLLLRSVNETAQLWLFYWLAFFCCSVAASRWAVGVFLERLQVCGGMREAVAVVGASGPRNRLAARLSASADVVGVYGAHAPDHLGQDDLLKLLELGRDGAVDSVVVAAETDETSDVAQLVERLKVLPVEVAVCSGRDLLQLPGPEMRIVGGVPVTIVADRPIKQRDLLFKTLFDKIGALLLLVLFAPLLLAIAVVIVLTSKGPVVFKQVRQGFCGRDFTVLKFRTMYLPPSEAGWLLQTERNDVRCTNVGRFLRRTSLDELPQLWNVLRGDMSLVGPRPHAGHMHGIDRAGREIVAEYAQRYRVKPGMTGWAQVNGLRGATTDIDQLRQRVAYDLHYIEHWSIWLDLQILARTAFCLFGENAY